MTIQKYSPPTVKQYILHQDGRLPKSGNRKSDTKFDENIFTSTLMGFVDASCFSRERTYHKVL